MTQLKYRVIFVPILNGRSFGRRTPNILFVFSPALDMKLGQLDLISLNSVETIHYNGFDRGLAAISMGNIGCSCLDTPREQKPE